MEPTAKNFRSTQKDEGKAEMMIEGDRISLLQEPIIHHILSLLPTRYATRTSVLSHKWYSFWSEFPVINLNEKDFLPLGEITQTTFQECRDRFIDCLQRTLSHHSMRNLDMLNISTVSLGNSELYGVIDRLVEESMKGKLKNLDLNIPCSVIHHIINGHEEACEKCYKLPPVVFLFGEYMLSLKLDGCNLLGFDENLSVKFLFLKTLSIRNTHVEGDFLEKVVRGSLAIESLDLCLCHGLKKFTISHKRMKKFALKRCVELDECRIDAPGLQSFKYKGYYMPVDGIVNIAEFNLPNDAFMFPSLIYLCLTYVNMKADTFNKMVSRFPKLMFVNIKESRISGRPQLIGNELSKLVIEESVFEEKLECRAGNLETVSFIDSSNIFTINENFKNLTSISFIEIDELTGSVIQLAVDSCPLLSSLVLISCNMLDSIKILSGRLEYLVICDCVNVKEVRILAHKLMFLKYTGPILKFSRLLTSNKLEAELHIRCDDQYHEDSEQFPLGEFLQMFSHCADSITLTCYCVECMNALKNSSDPSPLCNLNLLKVTTGLGVVGLCELLESMLRTSFRPKTMCLDLRSSSTIEMEFEGHTREEMLDQCNSITGHKFVTDHLIEVRIRDFAGLSHEVRLVGLLICNAASLRKVAITIRENSDLATEPRHRSKLISRIHNLPKASPDAEIIVKL